MSRNHYFKPKMPKGYRIFFNTFDVALANEYAHQIERLVGSKNVTLQLEAQPKNEYDPNAILIMGRKKGLIWSSTLVLGYLPKYIAKEVSEKKLTNLLIPRPQEMWEGDRGGFKFTVDLVGTREAYNKFDTEKILDLAKNTQKEAAKKFSLEKVNGKYELTVTNTGQKVKRAAPGGEGLVLDHFSTEAAETYFSLFGKAFKKKNYGVRAFYNDSYEVYGANWTTDFLAKFKELRGYDIAEHYNVLTIDSASTEKEQRIWADYNQTLHDLLLRLRLICHQFD